MLSKQDKKCMIKEMIQTLKSSHYDSAKFAKYVYSISLTEKIHLSNDKELYEIMYVLSGMDAGEEFTYTKNEVLEMLESYLKNMK